jgi:hypothetical protein
VKLHLVQFETRYPWPRPQINQRIAAVAARDKCDCITRTALDSPRKRHLKPDERCDFLGELFQVSGGQSLNLATRVSRRVGKDKQCPNLSDAEFQLARPANEPQPPQMVVCVMTVPAR